MARLSPPPAFQEFPPGTSSSSHLLIDFSENTPQAPGGENPPPDFTPYNAEYFLSNGNVISHDPHLNTDGEALYRFLLSQANTNPAFRLHCRGTHTETRRREVTERLSNGRTRTRHENYSETVTDFDFFIDVAQHIVTPPLHWSVADSEPAYRGHMVRELESAGGKQKASSAETKDFKSWVSDRTARGLPPWISYIDQNLSDGVPDNSTILKSSRTLREWADEYCASSKYLKEFAYEKVVYGWNFRQIEDAVRSKIKAALYRGDLHVQFHTTASKIYIRPDNSLSRTLSNKWLKFLTFVLLIYPFIWLFKRFHSRGGGRWEVCGGAYPLKRWVLINAETDFPKLDAKGAVSEAETEGIIRTEDGTSKLVGLKEGEWFRKWEQTIVHGVCNKYQSPTPLYTPTADDSGPAHLLDGF